MSDGRFGHGRQGDRDRGGLALLIVGLLALAVKMTMSSAGARLLILNSAALDKNLHDL